VNVIFLPFIFKMSYILIGMIICGVVGLIYFIIRMRFEVIDGYDNLRVK